MQATTLLPCNELRSRAINQKVVGSCKMTLCPWVRHFTILASGRMSLYLRRFQSAVINAPLQQLKNVLEEVWPQRHVYQNMTSRHVILLHVEFTFPQRSLTHHLKALPSFIQLHRQNPVTWFLKE